MFQAIQLKSAQAIEASRAMNLFLAIASAGGMNPRRARSLHRVLKDHEGNPAQLIGALSKHPVDAQSDALDITWTGKEWKIRWGGEVEVSALRTQSGWHLELTGWSFRINSSRMKTLLRESLRSEDILWTATGNNSLVGDPISVLEQAPTVEADLDAEMPFWEMDHLVMSTSRLHPVRKMLVGTAQLLSRFDSGHFLPLVNLMDNLPESPDFAEIAHAVLLAERQQPALMPLSLFVGSRAVGLRWSSTASSLFLELRHSLFDAARHWSMFLLDGVVAFKTADPNWHLSGNTGLLRRAQLDCGLPLDEWHVSPAQKSF